VDVAGVTDCFLEGTGLGSASLSLVDHGYILGVCGEPFPYVVSGVCHHCALNAHLTCIVSGSID